MKFWRLKIFHLLVFIIITSPLWLPSIGSTSQTKSSTTSVLPIEIPSVGPQGEPGLQGEDGQQGEVGPQGETGKPGKTGAIGPQGPTGATGLQGQIGATGPAGPTGQIGAVGPQGPTGATGPQGPQGQIGATGPAGGFGNHGSFFDTTTTVLPENTAIAIPLNSTASSNGVSIQDDEFGQPTRILFAESGVYNIAFSSQLGKVDGGTDIVSIWLSVNGTNLDDSSTDLFLSDSNEKSRTFAAWNFAITLNQGDFVQLMFSATNDSKTSVLAVPQQTNPDRPAIPSTILTVNQIGK